VFRAIGKEIAAFRVNFDAWPGPALTLIPVKNTLKAIS
jgi:hypothetical protein